MTPSPSLQQLIESVRADAEGGDALEQLAQAARTVAGLEEVSDALLGHFVDQCRRSGRSWSEISSALGVSKQAAHKRFSFSAPTFERFTARARAVLQDATEHARRLGSGRVEPEHLLLGLFEPAEALAAKVLSELGLTRAMVEEQLPAPGAQAPGPEMAAQLYGPGAVEVLRGAVEEALQLGHNYIGTEHLLLALYRDAGAVPSQVLVSLGASRDRVKDRVLEMLAGFKKP